MDKEHYKPSTLGTIERMPVTPPLENGDHLSREEFERRFWAMPELKKAELIQGVVFMPSPVRYESHGKPHSAVMLWLTHYEAFTPGVGVGDNTSVRLDEETEVQPDALLRIQAEYGGKTSISDDDFVVGAPELIFEVAASSASYDLHEKFRLYCNHGVQEYIVWRVRDGVIDWFQQVDNQFQRLEPDRAGVIESHLFPGLRLAVSAFIQRDLTTVLATSQGGIESDSHQLFVKQLQQNSTSIKS